MCLLILMHKIHDDYPVIIGANRDEAYSRIGTTPALIRRFPRSYGGRDTLKGGTWLGVNKYGLVIAVTNRSEKSQENSAARSRGLLVCALLKAKSASNVTEALLKKIKDKKEAYNDFNLLAVDRTEALAFYWSGANLRKQTLPQGMHVVTTGDFNDSGDAKIARVDELVKVHDTSTISQTRVALMEILADHKPSPGTDSICMHGENYGTVSSSIILVEKEVFAKSIYLHAQGAPCKNVYVDYSHILK